MTTPIPDAALVDAYLTGDTAALAAIYDRYAPALYDTAAAMLADRHEAADLVHDVICVAAERLGQLRDGSRLRPWLFAILRNEVYRRTGRRRRTVPTDFTAAEAPEMVAHPDHRADGAEIEQAELAELVRSAAAGLDERDQLILELSVRQGLQGADLADALGVTPEQSYGMVHRMRERVERSLGALTVARVGRRDCPELQQLLASWDGTFSVLVRKRVARHVDRCEVCERTRRSAAPIALLGMAPAFALPLELRDRVLADAGGGGSAAVASYGFDAPGGFPTVVRAARALSAWITAAAVMVALVVVGGVTLAVVSSDEVAAPADVSASTATPITSVAPATAPPSTAATTTTPSSSTTTAAPLPPAMLSVSATVIDLGDLATEASLVLTNTGGAPLAWSLQGGTPFAVATADATTNGTLEAGASVPLVVRIDRAALAEGDLASTLTVDAGTTPASVTLRARVEHPPTLSRFEVLTNTGLANVSACDGPLPSVRIAVGDESGLDSVRLFWNGPAGAGSLALSRSGTTWTGTIPTFPRPPGVWALTIEARDVRGNRADLSRTMVVDPCPG